MNEGATTCATCHREQPSALQGCLIFVVVAAVFGLLLFVCNSRSTPSENASGTATEPVSYADPQAVLDEMATLTIGPLESDGSGTVRRYVQAYGQLADIGTVDVVALFNCTTDHVFHKNDDLELSKVVGWCNMDRIADADAFRSQGGYVNFYERDKHFSGWDGRATQLADLVKASMNDPGSFKHVETRRRLLRREGHPAVWSVTMDYSGTNAFNARVRGSVEALVDIMTGDVLQIVREN